MVTESPKERLTVHIPVQLKREIEESAFAAGQTLTVWIERAARSYLEVRHVSAD